MEFAPLTIPAASQQPLGLSAMVPIPVSDAEQCFSPDESHTAKPSKVAV
jgi:hypothetical protein